MEVNFQEMVFLNQGKTSQMVLSKRDFTALKLCNIAKIFKSQPVIEFVNISRNRPNIRLSVLNVINSSKSNRIQLMQLLMNSLVCQQVRWLSESFPTHRAREWPLPSVSALVYH